MTDWLEKPVFLSGATGFIGSHLHRRLRKDGLEVRCGSRHPDKARPDRPPCEWVKFDVEDPDTMPSALEGCGSAVYLVHQMKGGEGYRERERSGALAFRRAAEGAGVERVVYLGGVEPAGTPSEHLSSRLEVGSILRGGDVSTIELRASMIIGANSASWQIVRDLAARLPVMILPRWTRSRSQPVDISDVVEALVGALRLDIDGSAWFDIPGPEVLTVEAILHKTARVMGQDTLSYPVPLLSPRLSSFWLRFVTQADLYMARELVEGLEDDLLAQDHAFWERIGHTDLTPFDEAAKKALEGTPEPSVPARAYEALVRRFGRFGR